MDYRQRVTGALKELAVVRGFYGVTMDELAAHAGISKRTIYRYFKSKEEIINSVMEYFMFSTEQKVLKALDSSNDPVEKIVNVIKVVTENVKLLQPLALQDLQKYYPHIWEKVEQFRAGKIQQVFENLIVDNEKKCFREINPKIFTTALMASVKAVVNPGFIMENNLYSEETIQSLFTIFLYGIVNPGK